MAESADPHSLSRPTIYLALMAVFVALAGFLVLILYRPIATAFAANPGLNGLIIGVLILGIVLSVFQVMRLMPEIKWVNGFRLVDHGAGGFDQPNPRLLSQLASYLRDSQGAGGPTMSTQTVRSILESVGTRLDEGREILRYMIGLLVFLGLLGTFWGLTQTIASVGDTIDGLDVTSGDFGTIFENLKTGLSAPLDGMGTAFSSSLFGLAGSLVLGFLDLQAGQAQNRFYTELEDWMSNMAGVDVSTAGVEASSSETAIASLERSVDRLARQVAAQNQLSSAQTGSSASSAGAGDQADVKQSIDSLAAGVQSLVQHMRSEQQMLRDWVEDQGEHTKRLATVMEDVSRSMANSAANGGRGQEPGE
ncbi:MAG: flagellar motor protein MotA [Hyphomicrobiales bacterium]